LLNYLPDKRINVRFAGFSCFGHVARSGECPISQSYRGMGMGTDYSGLAFPGELKSLPRASMRWSQ
jgi:hypothetical protein